MRTVSKKLSAIALCLMLAACADTKVINGTEYDTYGPLNDEKKSPDVEYSVSGESVFWGIIFFETIIAPIYFFGFDLFEPEGLKDPNESGDS